MDLISTTIRILHNAVPAQLEGNDNNMTCAKIAAELGRFGVRADLFLKGCDLRHLGPLQAIA